MNHFVRYACHTPDFSGCVSVAGGGRELRKAEVSHEDEELDDRLPATVSLGGEAFVRDVVRPVRPFLARLDAPLDDVRLVPVIVPLVEDAGGDPLRALRRDPGELLDRLPDAEVVDPAPLALRMRAREGVLDRMHHLVETEAAPARAGSAFHDDLAEEAVEEVVAPDDGARGERAGDRGAGERLRKAVRERPHVVEALAGVAELAPEKGVRPVGLGLRPEEERVPGQGLAAVTRWRVATPEAPRGVEGAVVDQVAEDVGTGGLASVAFYERPVSRRLDDGVPVEIESEGRRRQDRRGGDGEQGTTGRDLVQRRSHGRSGRAATSTPSPPRAPSSAPRPARGRACRRRSTCRCSPRRSRSRGRSSRRRPARRC